MKIPFVDLHAQYLNIKSEIDAAIAEVIAESAFIPGKNLGAYGDAGCLVTNDGRLADWVAMFARHGGKGEHVMEGINSRMDGLQAAILNVKLSHLPAWTEARQRIARSYDKLLADIEDVATPKARLVATMFFIFTLFAPRSATLCGSILPMLASPRF